MAARLTSIACILFGGLLYWTALGSDTPRAYFFPQMLAVAMAAMGAAMLVMDFRNRGKRRAAGSPTQWYKIWPGMFILVVYMAIAEQVGFYVSSWLAFTSIGILYAPTGDRMATAKRCVPISVVFLAVLYLVFWTLLSVQLPHGFAF
jgi:Tripartite tricarboxylate transporter TctB family